MSIFRRGLKVDDERSKFWSWFANEAPLIVFPPPAFVLDAIGDHLRRVHPGLAFQIGKSDDGLVLEISADGNPVLIPSVRDVCAAAPVIPGWSVCAFRQPITAASIAFGDRVLRASDLSFVMADVVDGRAVIGVFVEGLAETPQLADAAFALLQGIAGELVFLTRIHKVLFADGSDRPDDALPVLVLADYLENLDEHVEEDGPREGRDWMVAKVELNSGENLIVSLRTRVPEGVTPETFGHRVSLRCPYPDRGDGSGHPTPERLQAIKALEVELGEVAPHLMSKTGQGARESIFQANSASDFRTLVAKRARELGIDCACDVTTDPTWQLWRQTLAQFAAPLS